MKKTLFPVAALALALTLPGLRADDATNGTTTGEVAPNQLVDFTQSGVDAKFTPSDAQVTVSASTTPPGVVVSVQPGESKFPGITVKPDRGSWDLSKYGHVEVRLTNLSDQPLTIGMRIDAETWDKNNGAKVDLNAGETLSGQVTFGYNYGTPLKLNTSSLSELLVFGPPAPAKAYSFRIEVIQAGGTPGEQPAMGADKRRINVPGGVLLGPGAQPLTAANLENQKDATGTLVDSTNGQNLKITFPSNAAGRAGIQPIDGRWALIEGVELRAKVRNDGATPITPSMQVTSNGAQIDSGPGASLAPGAETDLVASYMSPVIWHNTPPSILKPDPGTGSEFTSSSVSGIFF